MSDHWTEDASFVVRRSGDLAEVRICGTLCRTDASAVRRRLGHLIDAGVTCIDLDLGGIQDADPAGLATLVIAARRLRGSHGRLSFSALSDESAEILSRLHLFVDDVSERRPQAV
ncbi:MAG TPA: STAS domain-containing protein [Mycobacteriales bacterium]|nr:STAS domain-containing protein [Mycobacteriales bacterium]